MDRKEAEKILVYRVENDDGDSVCYPSLQMAMQAIEGDIDLQEVGTKLSFQVEILEMTKQEYDDLPELF